MFASADVIRRGRIPINQTISVTIASFIKEFLGHLYASGCSFNCMSFFFSALWGEWQGRREE